MKKFFVFIAGLLGSISGIAFVIFVLPRGLTDSIVFMAVVPSFIISSIATLNSNKETETEVFKVSNSKKILAIILGTLLGGISAIIIDSWFRYDKNAIYLAPLVSYITARIVLESKLFNDIEIGGFFRSKVWLILQTLWVVLVIFTAKYDSYYPQKVYLFYSFFRKSYGTTGLIQALILALPFITNIYYWFKK